MALLIGILLNYFLNSNTVTLIAFYSVNQLMSFNAITNRTVKLFIKAHDFYPGLELEEECFSKAVPKDVDQYKSRFRKKSDIDEDGSMERCQRNRLRAFC
jgi:hypothetical protein